MKSNLILVLLLILPFRLFAQESRMPVTLLHAKTPHFIELIEDGVVRVSSQSPQGKSEVVFQGKAHSLSLPVDNNQGAIKMLQEAGIYTFEASSSAERIADLLVVLSNGGVFVYDGASASMRQISLPIEKNVNPSHVRLSDFHIDWKTSNPLLTVYSFGYLFASPTNGIEGRRSGTYYSISYSPTVEPIAKQIHSEFTAQLSLIERAPNLEVSFKAGNNIDRQKFIIPNVLGPNPGLLALPYDPKVPPGELVEASETERTQERTYRDYLREFSHMLNKLVHGQPEGVELLLDIEKQNIINNGQRQAPEVGLFMGLPGTGKDTLVEAYIRARMAISLRKSEEPFDLHIYRAPVAKKESDIWSFTGSGTGYVGSGKVSALNRFLVLHSGGRYEIKKTEGSNPEEYIVENSNWRPGKVLDGYFAPQDGALFINEFHDWSLEAKNAILKEALEKGYFTVGSPGKGVNRLQVPINIFIASNDGIGLITARDRDGRRIGAPLSEAKMLERWALSAKDKQALKRELSNSSPANPEGGTSEEVLSRIPNSRTLLLRPLPSQVVLRITKAKLASLQEKFLQNKAMGFPNLYLEFTPKLIKFLANYDQLAEEGARPIDDKIKSLVEKTLSDALFSGKLTFKPGESVQVSVQRNADNTYSLIVGGKPVMIQATEKGRNALPITDQQIDKLAKLEGALNAKVKGVEHITKALARDIRRSANTERASHPDLETKLADVYAFLGTSSTGKTELATVLHQVLFETTSKPLVIDFSQIQTAHDLKEKILGFRDARNKGVASDFMSEYDRTNGRLVVVMDEISNANPEVLKGLYDLLREPVVRTFSDGKARAMGQVRIVLTGNAGEEWYSGIPRDAPEVEQLEAARQIYEKSITNEGFVRRFLMTKFSEAFLNRIGLHRIFFFGPHTAKNTRELIQLRLVKALKEFSEQRPGRRSWSLRFETADDYRKTIESIESYGFKLWEQGASIGNFINQVMINEIHDLLLLERVPAGTEVLIRKLADKPGKESTAVNFELVAEGRRLAMTVNGKVVPRGVRRNPKDIVLTAYHEAGHEIVNKILLGDKMKSGGVSILPGVTEIGGQWLRYEGIARQEQTESLNPTREVVLAKIAVLLGGEAAEKLVTKNARHTAGISNDIERATSMARSAVLKWGLSEAWGVTGPGGQDLDKFISGLSEERRKLLETEVHRLVEEGRALARSVLIANYENLFLPMGSHLAKKGEIRGEVLERFYQIREREVVRITEEGLIKQLTEAFESRRQAEAPPVNIRDFEFYSFVQQPKDVADPEAIRQAKRARELALVDLSPGMALVGSAVARSAGSRNPVGPIPLMGSCDMAFRPAM